eukprot:6201392-Pleurochrysis_carterae.AAC.3
MRVDGSLFRLVASACVSVTYRKGEKDPHKASSLMRLSTPRSKSESESERRSERERAERRGATAPLILEPPLSRSTMRAVQHAALCARPRS